MKLQTLINFSILLTVFGLAGCKPPPAIENHYDVFKKTNAWTLKNCPLGSASGGFLTKYIVDLNLEQVNQDKQLAHFIVLNLGEKTTFKPSTSFLFQLKTKNNKIEEITLFSTSLSKSSGHSRINEIIFSAEINREQILKIINSQQATLIIETMSQPIVIEIESDNLAPIREYIYKCFPNNL